MKTTRILLVEDEADIRALIAMHLGREGFEVVSCGDAIEGWKLLGSEEFSLAIVDWMLPGGMSGLDLTRQVRTKFPKNPMSILMLTARVSDIDIVAGLEAGADDYVTKPFEMPVLMARVRALARRSRWMMEHRVSDPEASVLSEVAREAVVKHSIRVGELELFEESHRLEVKAREVPLTPYEFKLMVSLMKNAGKVLTRERLMDLVQGSGVSVVDRAIDTHVFGLRKKLGSSADHIETVRGVGYRMCPPEGPARLAMPSTGV